MVNTFDQELVETAEDFLTAFSETVTYYPSAGGSRAITAIVNRKPPERLEGAPHGKSHSLEMQVANDSTTGISSDEVNTMKDQVNIVVRLGDTAIRRLITEIISQDAGMMTLGIR